MREQPTDIYTYIHIYDEKFTNEYLHVVIHTALEFPNKIEMRRIRIFKQTHMSVA